MIYQPDNYSSFLTINTTVSLVLQYIQLVNRTYCAENTVPKKPFIWIHGYLASCLPPFQNLGQTETFKLKDLDNFPVSCSFIKHMLLPDFFWEFQLQWSLNLCRFTGHITVIVLVVGVGYYAFIYSISTAQPKQKSHILKG